VSIFYVIAGKIVKFYIVIFTDGKYLIRTIQINFRNWEKNLASGNESNVIVRSNCTLFHMISHFFSDAARRVTLFVYLLTFLWMKEA
jgi:hypothetical protein